METAPTLSAIRTGRSVGLLILAAALLVLIVLGGTTLVGMPSAPVADRSASSGYSAASIPVAPQLWSGDGASVPVQANDGDADGAPAAGTVISMRTAPQYIVMEAGEPEPRAEGDTAGPVRYPSLMLNASMPSAGHRFEFVSAEWLADRRVKILTRVVPPDAPAGQVVTPASLRILFPGVNNGTHFIEAWMDTGDGAPIPAGFTMVTFSTERAAE